jgi:prolyl oligopeptidase PreP (S9A serine peptidase family)
VIPNLRGGGEYGEKWHEAGAYYGKNKMFKIHVKAGHGPGTPLKKLVEQWAIVLAVLKQTLNFS